MNIAGALQNALSGLQAAQANVQLIYAPSGVVFNLIAPLSDSVVEG